MFASAYLTLTSIIQGVALAALVQRVEQTYGTFDATCWVMVAGSFIGIFIIWHEYLVQVMAYEWVPSLVDSIVPFAFVAGEVFMVHFVAHDVRDWLLAFGATFAVGLAAWVVVWRQTASNPREAHQSSSFRGYRRLRGLLVVPIALLAIAAGLLYNVLGLYRIQLIVACTMTALTLIFIFASIRYWSAVTAQAPTRHA